LNNSNLNGVNINVSIPVYHQLSAVLDSSAHFGSDERFYTFLAGAQYTHPLRNGRVFGHALFGKSRNDENIAEPTTEFTFGRIPSSLGLAIAFGGGYDYPLNSRFTLRIIQVDYLHTKTYETTQNNIRASAGIVIHFTRKKKK